MTHNAKDHKVDGTARIMVIMAWVVGVLLMAYVFQRVLDNQANPNQQVDVMMARDGVPVVVLQRNRQGHYVANGRIDGRVTTFLLDTGATDVAVPIDLADRLGLPRLGQGFSRTANGTVKVYRTRLDRVQLGAIEMRNVRATILPSMPPDAPVLLGMSFLKHLELLQRGDQLTLRQPGK